MIKSNSSSVHDLEQELSDAQQDKKEISILVN